MRTDIMNLDRPQGAPLATATGFKKISLAGIAAKPEKKGSDYPALPDPDGSVSELVCSIRAKQEQLDALAGALEIEKAELTSLARGFFFSHCHGKSDIPSSIAARNGTGEILVSFTNRYKTATDEEGLAALAGSERLGRHFRQKFELKVDGDLLPEASAETIIAELSALFASHGCGAALTAKATILPNKEYHTARHRDFTVDENLALERLAPCVVAVKTKGRPAGK